jgi:D-alanine transaminase
MRVYLNGTYLAAAEARLSVDDRGFLFGDGIYEVARAVDGRLFEAGRHLERLARGARALRLAAPAPDAMLGVWERLLHENGLGTGEALVYCQVTRGAAVRAHPFPAAGVPATVYAFAQALTPPDALRAAGASAVTFPDLRWGRCDLKTVNLLPNVLARQAAAEAGAFEAVLVRLPDDDAPPGDGDVVGAHAGGVRGSTGTVTEGSLSAVFGVVDGVLRTHPEGARILPSITRAVVLELAAALGVAHAERALSLAELRRCDELFVANTTADVLPITRLDGRPVGDGAPGPVTRALDEALAARVGRRGGAVGR